MDRKVSLERSLPKGIYVYNLSYPLSFAACRSSSAKFSKVNQAMRGWSF
jgi:hypothetical protein